MDLYVSVQQTDEHVLKQLRGDKGGSFLVAPRIRPRIGPHTPRSHSVGTNPRLHLAVGICAYQTAHGTKGPLRPTRVHVLNREVEARDIEDTSSCEHPGCNRLPFDDAEASFWDKNDCLSNTPELVGKLDDQLPVVRSRAVCQEFIRQREPAVQKQHLPWPEALFPAAFAGDQPRRAIGAVPIGKEFVSLNYLQIASPTVTADWPNPSGPGVLVT
jgi:hypothetical protein